MVEVSEEVARFIENGRKHYKYNSNVLAYVIHAIGIGLDISEIEGLTKAVYEGYTVIQ